MRCLRDTSYVDVSCCVWHCYRQRLSWSICSITMLIMLQHRLYPGGATGHPPFSPLRSRFLDNSLSFNDAHYIRVKFYQDGISCLVVKVTNKQRDRIIIKCRCDGCSGKGRGGCKGSQVPYVLGSCERDIRLN